MIIKADQSWHGKVIKYLSDEPALNLFIIADIENFGYESEFQDIWLEVVGEEIKGLLLRYYGNYLPYAKEKMNAEAFSEIINKDDHYEMLSGKKEITEQFHPYIDFKLTKETYFAELKDAAELPVNTKRENIKVASIADVEWIVELQSEIEEFILGSNVRHRLEQKLKTKTGRTYFIQEDEKIISCASTTAENSLSAMIVGVCSHPDKRNQGLASKCMEALCKDVLKEGKTLCLFYNNPKAGSIYKRLGFKDIGVWCMNYPSRIKVPETI